MQLVGLVLCFHPFLSLPSHPVEQPQQMVGAMSALWWDRDHKPISDLWCWHWVPDLSSLCWHQVLLWREEMDAPKLQERPRFMIFLVFATAGVIDPNKFWPLLCLMLFRPYMSAKSEGFTSAINLLCDESSGLVSIRFHIYMVLSRVGQQAKSWGSFFQINK